MTKTKVSKNDERKNLFLISIYAIFGGLFISYFGLILLVKSLFANSQDLLIIPLLFNTLLWPCLSLWIFMSKNMKNLYLKVIIPSSMIILVLAYLMF